MYMVLKKNLNFFNIRHFFAEPLELIWNESITKDQFALIGLKGLKLSNLN